MQNCTQATWVIGCSVMPSKASIRDDIKVSDIVSFDRAKVKLNIAVTQNVVMRGG